MKVMELVKFATSNKSKMLKSDQLQQLLVKTLDVKDYLTIKEKKGLVDDIINECIFYEDGMFKFDDIEKYIYFTMKTIAAYTNLELSDDIEEDYDALCRAKLLNTVVETFAGEYENVRLLLQMKCDYILSGNTMEAQFGKFLSSILEKVDSVVGMLEKFSDFDLSKLPVSADDLSKLMDFVNSQRK